VLRFVDEMTTAEIAAILGRSRARCGSSSTAACAQWSATPSSEAGPRAGTAPRHEPGSGGGTRRDAGAAARRARGRGARCRSLRGGPVGGHAGRPTMPRPAPSWIRPSAPPPAGWRRRCRGSTVVPLHRGPGSDLAVAAGSGPRPGDGMPTAIEAYLARRAGDASDVVTARRSRTARHPFRPLLIGGQSPRRSRWPGGRARLAARGGQPGSSRARRAGNRRRSVAPCPATRAGALMPSVPSFRRAARSTRPTCGPSAPAAATAVHKQLDKTLRVCPSCGHHCGCPPGRIDHLLDPAASRSATAV